MGVYISVTYTNYIGDTFYIRIDDDTYSGDGNQVQGKATLVRPNVKTMDSIRGSSLNIELEASTSDTWQNRLVETVGDKQLPVTFYKNGSVIWKGFIKADGIQESFVEDYWIVNIQAIDGLGLLENIKFLKSDGTAYEGLQSEITLLTRCLELTGLSMQFRIYYMNLFFTVVDGTDPTTSQQALEDTYVNTDRYVKEDQESTIFTAKEVLESILKKYGAFVCQQDNVWHIVRIIDFYTSYGSQPFALYDTDGSFVGDFSASPVMNETLGSDIDGYDPCHAKANQNKLYKAALGAYKVYYEYGIVKSILENPTMEFDDAAGTITGWTLDTTTADWYFTNQGTYYSGEMKPVASNSTRTKIITYDSTTYDNDFLEGDTIKIIIKSTSTIFKGVVAQILYRQFCQITFLTDTGTTYYLNQSGEWTLSSAEIRLFEFRYSVDGIYTEEATTTIDANGVDEDGTVTISFYKPNHSASTTTSRTRINEVNIAGVNLDVKGESYTARKTDNVTAVVDLEDKVYVGDSEADTYIGAIEDSSADNTLLWAKLDSIGGTMDTSKQYPLLNWLSRDRLTISSGNSTVFSGGVLGYLPYLSVLTINNVTGIFMTTEWSYDTFNNTIQAKHERIFTDDIYTDTDVEFNLEGENIVRPAIE